MTHRTPSQALQTLYGATKTPGWHNPRQKREAPLHQAPAQLGFGRPAQSAAGQP